MERTSILQLIPALLVVAGCGSSGASTVDTTPPATAGGVGGCAASCAAAGASGAGGTAVAGNGGAGGVVAGGGVGIGGSGGFGTGGSGGTPSMTLLADNEEDPKRIAVDESSVYWTVGGNTYGDGKVRRIAKAGGVVETLATGLKLPQDVAVDATTVFWIETGSGADGSLQSREKAGGPPKVLVGGLKNPSALALDNDYAYVAEFECGSISRVPKAGGAPQVVTTACDAASLMVSGSSVFWVGGGVGTATLPAGAAAFLVPVTQPGVRGALNGVDIYWSSIDASIHHVTTAGTVLPPLATKESGPTAVAVDAERVYWVSDGWLRAVPRGGGTPTSVAPIKTISDDVVVDGEAIYLPEEGPPGRIWKIAK